jgi:hypothetical protein
MSGPSQPDREVVAGGLAVGLILQFTLVGYSPRQILETLILGANDDSIRVTDRLERSEFFCRFLRDAGGRVVVPEQTRSDDRGCGFLVKEAAAKEDSQRAAGASPAAQAPSRPTQSPSVAPRPTATPAVGQLAGVYRGTVTLDQCTQTCATQCSVTAPISVELRPDGTVRGSAGGSVNFNGNECRNPLTVGPPITGRWDPSSTGPITLELEMGVTNNPPAILSLRIQGGKATISLIRDTRPSEQARYTQFDAEMTKQ